MKILLIGGTGVLSSAVTQEALRLNMRVTMINRGNKSSQIPIGVELIKADKNNVPFIKRRLLGKKFDAVIDFLCYTKAELERSFSLYSEFTNQYFFISSCAVYNTEKGEVCHEDSSKGDPMWSYSMNKYACEQHLL